ncbi:hypothetical protein F4777DRAFT_520880 [Nemania sp. FL0916]|nr:hypothetical protein F4777DRAFT_520880 [Nemania sp. FL0916]
MAGDVTAQTVHFRTACDPCSVAKVRCDKKHPACDRCLQIKLPCSYSESRKHGKQLWRKRLSRRRMRSPKEDGHQTGTALGTTATYVPAPPAATLLEQPGWNNLPPSRVSASTQLAQPNDLISMSNPGQHMTLDTPALQPAWPDFDIQIDMDSFADWELADMSSCAPPALESVPVPILNDRSSVPRSPNDTASTYSAHDCESRAISLLRLLQHSEMQEGARSCSIDPERYGELNLAPGFDRVLAVNKTVLDGWCKLMECSCALCPHLILLHVSILSKMLFWYRVAAREKPPCSEDADGLDSISSTSSSTASQSSLDPPTPDRFTVRPTKVQVGILSLDAEDQANLRRSLLLRELRRAEKAIDELMKVDRSTIENQGDETIRHSVQWALGGIARLKGELQDVIKLVREA